MKMIRLVCVIIVCLGVLGLSVPAPARANSSQLLQPILSHPELDEGVAPAPGSGHSLPESLAGLALTPPVQGQAGDGTWSGLFSPPGTSFQVKAVAVSGDNVYVGGGFITAGDVEAHYIARWNVTGQTWHPMGGLDDEVTAIYASAGEVFAGGEGFIARWDDQAGAWQSLGYVYGFVNAITGSGNYLYAAGNFSQIGSVPANHVARWNRLTQEWQALGSGTDSVVFALAVGGNNLYLGGLFDSAGGVSASRIARWNLDTGTWSGLGGGLTGGEVRALAAHGTDLYAGGVITQTGGVTVTNVARWDGGQWFAMGHNLQEYTPVKGLAAGDLGVYATTGLDDYSSGDGVRWNAVSQSWESLGSGLECFTSYCATYAVAVGAEQVYFGGDFVVAGGQSAFRAAAWDVAGSAWEPLYAGAGGKGLDGHINAIVAKGTDVYVGGEFRRAGPIGADGIARWDTLTHTWHALGDGVAGMVQTMLFVGDDLYVGGNLSVNLGGVSADFIARWDSFTQTWHAMGQGSSPGLNNTVEALAVKGDRLIVGGLFWYIDSGPESDYTDYLATWDLTGHTWTPVDGNLGNSVYSLLVDGDNIYVGGAFDKNAGSDYEHIARWDTSDDTWHEVAGGLGGNVHALVKHNGRIVAGGSFNNSVRRLNPALDAWELLPGGGLFGGFYYGSIAYDLLVAPDGNLIVGGDFDHAGGHPASMIAQYSPVCNLWVQVGAGTNSRVNALALLDGELYAGGQFALSDAPSSRLGSRPYDPLSCLYVPLVLH